MRRNFVSLSTVTAALKPLRHPKSRAAYPTRDASVESHPCAKNVFRLMTSFTHCPGTSFTLPRVRSTHGGGKSDGMEDDGYSGAARPVCGGGHAKSAALPRAVCRL